MNYRVHPGAALEHEEQVAFYEDRRPGLGARYHAATMRAIAKACESSNQFRIVRAPDIRRVSLHGFPFAIVFRIVGSEVQVLAIAHRRRKPNYWAPRT